MWVEKGEEEGEEEEGEQGTRATGEEVKTSFSDRGRRSRTEWRSTAWEEETPMIYTKSSYGNGWVLCHMRKAPLLREAD